jgi:WD40 repeat protein
VDYIGHAERGCLVAAILIGLSTLVRAAEPPVTAVEFTPGGETVVAGSQSGIAVLSWPGLEATGTIATELQHVNDLNFSPDGVRLAVSGGAPGQVGTVEVYSWPQTELLWRSRAHDDVAYGLGWSADGSLFATASLDRLCRVFDAASGEVVRTIEGHSRGVTAVALLDDVIVTSSLDQSLRVWDLETGEAVRTLNNHIQPVLDLAVRPASDEGALPMVASAGDDRTVRLWQPTIGRMVRFARLPSEVLCVDWSGDGRRLYAGCRDGFVRQIDPERVEITGEWQVFDGWVYSLAVRPDGRDVVAGGGEGGVKRIALGE